MKSNMVPGIRDRMHIRHKFQDGRCNVLISWADGEWKVEIFASEAHARDFAAANKMEVIDVSDNGS